VAVNASRPRDAGRDPTETEDVVSELDRSVDALLVPGFVGTELPAWVRRRVDQGLGGVALFARNITDLTQLRSLTDDLHASRGDVLVAVDEEGGDVTRLEAARGSRHPGALALGTIDDVALTRRVAASIGALLQQGGVDWTWSPVADVSSNPGNPVIGVRSYGADAELVARHAAATVRGLQSDAGILACAKHFPGHGDTDMDSHLGLPVVAAARDRLDATELAPFRSCIDAGVRTVMTGHLRVPALDPDLPATLSSAVVTDLLRGELGFTGVVVSDALEMEGVARGRGMEEAAVLAVLAGVDALCIGGHLADDDVVRRVHAALVGAVRSGRIGEGRVHESALRVAALAAWRADASSLHPAWMSDDECVAAAARAVSTAGRVTLGDGAPVVVLCDPAPGIAAGSAPWGFEDALRATRPDAEVRRVGDTTPVPDDLPTGRPLVLVLRDSGRHAWQRVVEQRLVDARPDVVVVELGVPAATHPRATGRITSHGASRSSVEAVVALLTAPDGRRPR